MSSSHLQVDPACRCLPSSELALDRAGLSGTGRGEGRGGESAASGGDGARRLGRVSGCRTRTCAETEMSVCPTRDTVDRGLRSARPGLARSVRGVDLSVYLRSTELVFPARVDVGRGGWVMRVAACTSSGGVGCGEITKLLERHMGACARARSIVERRIRCGRSGGFRKSRRPSRRWGRSDSSWPAATKWGTMAARRSRSDVRAARVS